MTARIDDALAHLDAAIDALTNDAVEITSWHDELPVELLERTIANDLDKIESAISGKGQTILGLLAAEIRTAVVELVAARAALGGGA